MKSLFPWATIVLSLGFAVWATSCGGAPPKPNYDHCKGIGAEAGDIWNQGLKNRLNFPKKIFAGTITAADAEFFVRNLDKFVADWQAVRHEACKEDPVVPPKDTSPPPKSPKVICLETVLERFDQLIDEIKVSTNIEYSRLTDIFAEVSSCAGRILLPAMEPKENPFDDDSDSSSSSDDDTDFDEDFVEEDELEDEDEDEDEGREDTAQEKTTKDASQFEGENPF